MKLCGCCGHESDDATCQRCGEASWLVRLDAAGAAKLEVLAVVTASDDAAEPAEVAKPKRSRK